jgi:large subunit ribosomal protein L22
MASVETRSDVRAEARYVRAAPRKAQLVVDQIRGRTVPEARTILTFMTRDAANDVRKVLDSAAANAEANHGLDADELYVAAAFVGAGPTLKRWRARARGRAGRIKKRTCHITIALAQPGGEEIPAPLERPAPVTQTEEPEPITVDDALVDEEQAPPVAEAPAEEAPAEEAPAEEKPTRTRAPRKKAAPAPEQAEAPEVEGEAEEKPKPRRRRAAEAKAETEPKDAAKPKTTRSRKKTTESDTESEGSES